MVSTAPLSAACSIHCKGTLQHVPHCCNASSGFATLQLTSLSCCCSFTSWHAAGSEQAILVAALQAQVLPHCSLRACHAVAASLLGMLQVQNKPSQLLQCKLRFCHTAAYELVMLLQLHFLACCRFRASHPSCCTASSGFATLQLTSLSCCCSFTSWHAAGSEQAILAAAMQAQVLPHCSLRACHAVAASLLGMLQVQSKPS